MDFSAMVQTVTGFISLHPHMALGVIFLLAFGESLAFISLLLPATVILLATGALIGDSGLAFFPVWLAATIGAFAGDWLSWWLGYRYSYRVTQVWPLSRNPVLIQRGHAFFERWGAWGVYWPFLRPASGRSPSNRGDLYHADREIPVRQRNLGHAVGIWHTGSRCAWSALAC